MVGQWFYQVFTSSPSINGASYFPLLFEIDPGVPVAKYAFPWRYLCMDLLGAVVARQSRLFCLAVGITLIGGMPVSGPRFSFQTFDRYRLQLSYTTCTEVESRFGLSNHSASRGDSDMVAWWGIAPFCTGTVGCQMFLSHGNPSKVMGTWASCETGLTCSSQNCESPWGS